MTGTLQRPTRPPPGPRGGDAGPPPRGPGGRGLALARWAAVLLVSSLLLLAHGCHGDEDNELFAIVRSVFGSEKE